MMDDGAREGCLTCRANRGEIVAPGGVIYEDALWRLEHSLEPIPMIGWLILKPLRHVEAFADFTPRRGGVVRPTRQAYYRGYDGGVGAGQGLRLPLRGSGVTRPLSPDPARPRDAAGALGTGGVRSSERSERPGTQSG